MERRPIVIVGSGPAGAATALFLHARAPGLAGEVLIVEKAHHPRFKVCAGGLIPHTLACLRELNVPLSVPNVVVHRARVDTPRQALQHEGEELCRVIRRDEFDHALVQTCRARGIEVREGEKVLGLVRDGDGVRLHTERGEVHARIVVAADGSGSVVRRQLAPAAPAHVGRAVMCDVPLAACSWNGFEAQRYDFSFTAVGDGLRGYAWSFPCWIDGVPHVNVGVYSVDAEASGGRLNRGLDAAVDAIGGPVGLPRKAFPIRWYGRRTTLALPQVLFAGDAAGAEPLMGEGISFAFEYGRRAADAAARALLDGADAAAEYRCAVEDSWLGRKLRRLEMATRLFYGPTWRLWFGIASHSRVAREIGLRWYNGVDGWDRRSGWDALQAWWRGVADPSGAVATSGAASSRTEDRF